MEADKDAAGRLSRVSPPLTSASTPNTSLPQPNSVPASKQRQMFTVELRPEETTVVSWKRLIKESGSGNGEDPARTENKAALEVGPLAGVHLAGEDLKHTLQPPNCFSTVIEKIERLYMGKESSDEEELVAPDDEQYDTEDSFIDDTELDEYFQVDKLSTKHNGYFVNRGKLEWNEWTSSPNLERKKRRRKDSAEVQNEIDHEHEHVPNENANRGNMKIKAAARSVPLVAKNLNPGKVVTEPYQEGKLRKIKPNASPVRYKKQSADFGISLDISPSARKPKKDVSSVKLEPKDVGKINSLSSKGPYKSSCTSESLDGKYQTSQEKAVASQVESQTKLFNFENEIDQLPKIQCKDSYKAGEYPHMSSSMTSCPTQTVQPSSHQVREVLTMRPKGTTLERAIQELEKIVALSRPSNSSVQEVDPSVQGVKRRLPQEVKQKLAKVARLSASQGKISEEELIDRLMGFLGHLVQRKTLKRNMRDMVELGLSAKKQKADKLQQIKKDVLDMIKSRVSILKSKVPDHLDSSADDFQNVISMDERKALTGRYSMDAALEEKLCDLYDLYVEGMDEDKGPQSRKLYVEFAELWPAGYMDNLGIKDAIYRTKKRRQLKLQVRNKERIERKKLAAAAVKLEEPQAGQERHLVRQDRPTSNPTPPLQNKLNDPTPHRSDGYGPKHHEKAAGSSRDIVASDGGSKKMKLKPGMEGEFLSHPQKHNSNRPNNDSNLLLQPKPAIQMPASPPTSNLADHS